MKQTTAILVIVLMVHPVFAQQPLAVSMPQGKIGIRSYKTPIVSPIRLGNSGRLQTLIRAGKLYLTVQDAVALAIENSLDLEVSRYGPLMATWQLRRAKAGGPLRGVTGGNTQIGRWLVDKV